ncbi:hypothetical protein POM88_021804 [Heracleum sosnowskyi]|uniref:DUF1639 family protein n=1 Tax=Heracleum sosnowskyi TaxID=360622 RepID=A0AAD8IE31_9APIA|nr:hypothetical protein POM88_021804 [Heracleum sosnowskyi]
MENRKERSSSRERLHYFTLPDNGLKWGVQRQLRCMKVNPNCRNFDQVRSFSAPVTDRTRKLEKELTPPNGVSPVKNSGHRVNGPVSDDSVVDLERVVDGMRISDKGKGKAKVSEDDCNENRPVGLRSWNLRTRRSACKAPQGIAGRDIMSDVPAVPVVGLVASGAAGAGFSPVRRIDSRLRGGGGMGSGVEQKTERAKFSFALSKEEIEDDFFAMTGAKPPRRPKRRPKALQRKLNDLVPGFWLSEVTPETYKVDDNPEPKKGSK